MTAHDLTFDHPRPGETHGDFAMRVRGDERDGVLRYLHDFAGRYPEDVFPSHANGGDITGNAGAAARHVLTTAADTIDRGDHVE